jgi:hypothetical protein
LPPQARRSTIAAFSWEAAMLYEMRVYEVPPGQGPAFVKLVEEFGKPIRGDRYGRMEGYWLAEFGALNRVWHLWSHDSLAARADNRRRLSEDKAWTGEFVPLIKDMILRQDIMLLNPVRELTNRPTTRGNVYEFRDYRCAFGKAPAFAKALADAMPIRERHSKNVGLWQGGAPQPNQVCHLWVYADLKERAEKRARVAADPDWQGFLKANAGMLVDMHSTVLVPTAFSPLG